MQFVPSQEGDTSIVVTAADPYGATASVSVLVHATAASVPAPTLNVAVTSWTAGVAGTSAVSATLEGNIACMVESVSISDGSTAIVSNGTLAWTPPASNLSSSVTATFRVSYNTDHWDLDQVLSVAATPAPSAPSIDFSNVTHRSFNATWSSSAGGPVASYKVRAWTGRATPVDATGGASESFSNYVATAAVPDGWTFDHAEAYTGNTYSAYPVGFKGVSGTAVSPDFGGVLTALSFRLRSVSAEGAFIVYAAPSGSDAWTAIANYTSEAGTLKTEAKTISLNAADGYSKIKFEFVRTGGSAAFGTFVVSGTDWPAADFLEGWGGAKVSVGSATSQTISNPVAGTVNYVEVTAIGPTGLSTSTIASINVPLASNIIISVK